jgi:hypothetical protein
MIRRWPSITGMNEDTTKKEFVGMTEAILGGFQAVLYGVKSQVGEGVRCCRV